MVSTWRGVAGGDSLAQKNMALADAEREEEPLQTTIIPHLKELQPSLNATSSIAAHHKSTYIVSPLYVTTPAHPYRYIMDLQNFISDNVVRVSTIVSPSSPF